MTVNEPSGGVSRAAVTEWVAAARKNDVFIGAGAVVLAFATLFFVFGVHGDTYHKSGVPGAIGYLGAIAAQALVVALIPVTLTSYPTAGARPWWRVLAGVTVVLMLFFGALPAIVAGYSWLAVLLLTLATLVYDLAVGTWLTIVRPWAYLTNQPET